MMHLTTAEFIAEATDKIAQLETWLAGHLSAACQCCCVCGRGLPCEARESMAVLRDRYADRLSKARGQLPAGGNGARQPAPASK